MAKKILSASEIVESHIPKKIEKYKFIFKDEDFLNQLESEGYDISRCDTINNQQLVNTGLDQATFKSYDRVTVSKAKQPTVIDEDKGIVVSKQMITKADKKLLSVNVGTFTFQEYQYVMVKFSYEKFDIVEIFLLITIYAVKALYNEMLEDKKRHEIMLTERLELVTKTNMEISHTNKMLVEEISKNLSELNREVERTNVLIKDMLDKN